MVDFTLDFTGSENIKIENQSDLVAQAMIKPMSSHIVAVVRAYDVNWNLQCKIRMSKRSPTMEEQETFIKEDASRLH